MAADDREELWKVGITTGFEAKKSDPAISITKQRSLQDTSVNRRYWPVRTM